MFDLPYDMRMTLLASRLEQFAADARYRCMQIAGAVATSEWEGTAARAFRHSVDDLTAHLRLASGRLDEAATVARRHAVAVAHAEEDAARERAAMIERVRDRITGGR